MQSLTLFNPCLGLYKSSVLNLHFFKKTLLKESIASNLHKHPCLVPDLSFNLSVFAKKLLRFKT